MSNPNPVLDGAFCDRTDKQFCDEMCEGCALNNNGECFAYAYTHENDDEEEEEDLRVRQFTSM